MHSKCMIPGPGLQGRYIHHLAQRIDNTKAAKLWPGATWQLARTPKAAPDWHKTKLNGAPFIYPTKGGPWNYCPLLPPAAPSLAWLPGLILLVAEFSLLSYTRTSPHSHSVLTTLSPSLPSFKLHYSLLRASPPVWPIHFLTWVFPSLFIPALPLNLQPSLQNGLLTFHPSTPPTSHWAL